MKRFLVGVTILALSFVLVSCGEAPTPTPPPTSTPEPPTETPLPEPPTSTATPVPPSPTTEPTATSEPPTPTVVAEGLVNAEPSLNLRAGAATAFDILASMPTGTKTTLLERNADGTWVKVKTEEFGEGWVAAEFVDTTYQVSNLPVASDQPTPLPQAASTEAPSPAPAADTPAPAVVEPTATIALPATPVPGGDIDEYLNALKEGTHNELAAPVALGPAPAGGKTELVIANDSPFALKISLGSPARTETALDACVDCKVYEEVGPESCPPEKPQKTLRIDSGPIRLAIETSSTDVVPYVGEWTLEGNQRYSLCFHVLRSPQ